MEIKCKLCDINNAISIKSHIFSHFFIKSLINPTGITKRGQGRSFALKETSGIKSFIEGEVHHSDFKNLFGDEEIPEDKIIELLMDPYSREYFLCKKCEDRIKIIEDYFNDNVYHTLLDESRVKDNESIQPGNNTLIRLFFYSLIWRASAANFDNFQLDSTTEENLRVILNSSLGNNLGETIYKSSEHKSDILKFPLFLGSSKIFTDTTSNLILIENSQQPYYFEINEYSILFFKDSNLNIQVDLKGMGGYVNNNTININEDKIKIILIANKDWDKKIELFGKPRVKKLMMSTKSNYIKHYLNTHKCKPTKKQSDLFLKELIYGDDTTLALRYSNERIIKLINKHTK